MLGTSAKQATASRAGQARGGGGQELVESNMETERDVLETVPEEQFAYAASDVFSM